MEGARISSPGIFLFMVFAYCRGKVFVAVGLYFDSLPISADCWRAGIKGLCEQKGGQG